MKSVFGRFFAFAVFGSLLMSADAAYYWRVSADDPSGTLTNDVHFYSDNNQIPMSSLPFKDTLQVWSKDGESVLVTLPSGAAVVNDFNPSFKPGTGSALTVDLQNASWTQADSADAEHWGDNRFQIAAGNKALILQSALNGDKKSGVYSLRNALMTVTDAADGCFVDFRRGTFDFLTPNGKSLSDGYYYLFSANNYPEGRGVISFHEGSETYFPYVLVYASGENNELNFLGGSHYISNLKMRSHGATGNDDYARTRVKVAGEDTELQLSYFSHSDTTAGTAHGFRFDVTDGGTLTVLGSITQRADCDYDFVFDGGRLSRGTGTSAVEWSNARVFATNSTFATESAVYRIKDGFFKLKDTDWSAHSIALTGASGLLDVSGGSLSATQGDGLSIGADNKASTLALSGGATVSAQKVAGGTSATLAADGATLVATAETSSFISGFGTATVGAGGLTIRSDRAVTIPQSFAAGETSGALVLDGSGVKTLKNATVSTARLVAAGGETVLDATAAVSAPVVVRGGAHLTVGVASLGGLSVGDADAPGILGVTAGKTAAVNGPVEMTNVHLAVSGSLSTGAREAFFRTSRSVSDATVAAWRDAFIVVGRAEGLSYAFDVVANDQGGFDFVLDVTSGDPSLVITQTEGSGTMADAKTFGKNNVLGVTVAGGADLTLSGKISQGGIDKAGDGVLFLTNPENFLMGGVVVRAGLFSIPSVAVLGYVPGVDDALTLCGGTFGYAGDGESEENLAHRLVLNAPVATDAVVLKTDSPLAVAAAQVDSGVLIKRGAGTLTFAPASGMTMTLSSSNGKSSNGVEPDSPYLVTFDEQGTAPVNGYTGFSVAEGEVLLKGDATTTVMIPNAVQIGIDTPDGTAQPTLTIDGLKANIAGSKTTVGGKSVSSGLAIGVEHAQGYSKTHKLNQPRLNITNGAEVTTLSVMVGRQIKQELYPTVTVERATWTVSGELGASYHYSCFPQYRFLEDARVFVGSVSTYGGASFLLDGAVMAKNVDGDCFDVSYRNAGGTWRLTGDSVLSVRKFSTVSGIAEFEKGVFLDFDGATLKTASDWQLFRFAATDFVTVRTLSEGGLVIPVPEGRTVYIGRAIGGAGGVVKTGPGRMAFETQGTWDSTQAVKTPDGDSVTLAFGGTLDVREGEVVIESGAGRAGGAYAAEAGASVDFSNASVLGAKISGAGTFSNATLANPTICLRPTAEGGESDAPALAGVTLSGTVRVDFGRTADNPLDLDGKPEIEVLRFTGTAPDVSGWKLIGAGVKCAGGFSVVGNSVVARPYRTGLALIIR